MTNLNGAIICGSPPRQPHGYSVMIGDGRTWQVWWDWRGEIEQVGSAWFDGTEVFERRGIKFRVDGRSVVLVGEVTS